MRIKGFRRFSTRGEFVNQFWKKWDLRGKMRFWKDFWNGLSKTFKSLLILASRGFSRLKNDVFFGLLQGGLTNYWRTKEKMPERLEISRKTRIIRKTDWRTAILRKTRILSMKKRQENFFAAVHYVTNFIPRCSASARTFCIMPAFFFRREFRNIP